MSEFQNDPIFQAFITTAREAGKVWVLAQGEDLLVVESVDFEDTDVMPFWSSEAAAQLHCTEEWAEYKPEAIALDVFCEGWLKEMYDDGVLIGTDWDESLNGPEVEPREVLEALAQVQ
jgi:hypothetical protein